MRALGIDTSNYTCSVALFDSQTGEMHMKKRLLPVPKACLGLRQSQALFEHLHLVGDLLQQLFSEVDAGCDAIGVSVRPRCVENSYMPCFLAGEAVAQSIAAAMKIPVRRFSHQQNHIAAALYSADRLDLLSSSSFIAFHVSGGTTDCLLVNTNNSQLSSIQTLSSSLDLNAGQVIDRVGAMMGLAFPAGSRLEQLASTCPQTDKQNIRVKVSVKQGNCCLSGLENQCARLLHQGKSKEYVAYYCLRFLQDTLHAMLKFAYSQAGRLPVLFSGGVMSNQMLQTFFANQCDGVFARPEYSSDNAAGVAVLACGERI